MPPRAASALKVRHLTEDELAERLGITPEAVKRWRKQGRGPDYLKGDGDKSTVRYPVAWIEEWENSHRVRLASTA